MKSHFKSVVSLSLFLTSFVLSACSGPVNSGSGPGPGTGSGPFTVGGTVTGLTGTGLRPSVPRFSFYAALHSVPDLHGRQRQRHSQRQC